MRIWPPGAGRTMIACRIPTLLPPLADHERFWLEAEYDGLDLPSHQRIQIDSRPFRAPHHTVSPAGLVGLPARPSGVPHHMVSPARLVGSPARWLRSLPPLSVPRAGEVHLARFGVLMLDDIGEFSTLALRSLAWRLDQMTGAPFVAATATPSCATTGRCHGRSRRTDTQGHPRLGTRCGCRSRSSGWTRTPGRPISCSRTPPSRATTHLDRPAASVDSGA